MTRSSRLCRRKRLSIAVHAVALLLGSNAAGQSTDIAAWAGVWKGTLVNLPLRPDAAVVDVTMRLRDGILEEEILTAVDQPATAGVVALEPHGIQRLTFRRVDGAGESPESGTK